MDSTFLTTLAQAEKGFVIAPAGCGKTEGIVRAIKDFSTGKQLVLTHTHAGVAALKKRLTKHEVGKEKFHIDTIAGWALGWVRKYPTLSEYSGSLPIPKGNEYQLVYSGLNKLLDQRFVQQVIQCSYSGILVDEYQDCTAKMHEMFVKLNTLRPLRVLGDPLQGIFDMQGDLVNWTLVEDHFSNIPLVPTPFRWINAANPNLGSWLLNSRSTFERGIRPTSFGPEIGTFEIQNHNLMGAFYRAFSGKSGTICFIGPKLGIFKNALLTTLINLGFRKLENTSLTDFGEVVDVMQSSAPLRNKEAKISTFVKSLFSGLNSADEIFIEAVLKGSTFRGRDESKKNIHAYSLSLDLTGKFNTLISYYKAKGNIRRHELVEAAAKILDRCLAAGEDISLSYSNYISARKLFSRYIPDRCIGTTLLLKGLEFDHAIIHYVPSSPQWNNPRDLYVALTRGSKSVSLLIPE